MTKLTRKQALEMSLEKWIWHYENPELSLGSADFPKIKNGEWPEMRSHCPCCEYVKQYHWPITQTICKNYCPINWPIGRCTPESRYIKPQKESYFYHWTNAITSKMRKKYAKLIVDLIKKELE